MFTGSFPIYTRWPLSTVTTIRVSTISRTVFVFGTSTSMPDCKIGAVIMKIISSTSTTSMNGIMLISDSEVCVCFESCNVFFFAAAYRSLLSLKSLLRAKTLFNLRRDFQRKGIQPLPQFTNIAQKTIIKNYRWDCGEQSRRGGHQGFRNSRRDGAQAGGARRTKTGKRINNAPHRAEKTDERGHGASGSQPGHTLFDAANLFRRCQLHINRNS